LSVDRAIFFGKFFLFTNTTLDKAQARAYNSTMKMTIVIDSDDPEGIQAALKVARLMHTQYVGGTGTYHKESFGKIEFIKILRKYMRESLGHLYDEHSDQVNDIDDMVNLRNAKRFADRIFLGER